MPVLVFKSAVKVNLVIRIAESVGIVRWDVLHAIHLVHVKHVMSPLKKIQIISVRGATQSVLIAKKMNVHLVKAFII